MGMAVEDNEIFVVDDDPAVRDALRVVFELEGYRVSAFPDGLSFLAAARNRMPGCVLLDVHMPGRSGLDILNELGRAIRRACLHDLGPGRHPHGRGGDQAGRA